jgi:bifunctional enzyme CysN/CysC
MNMDWYHGPTVLELLEDIHIASDSNLIDVRFPVQIVIRPHRMHHQDFRGYAGTVAGGVLKPGDDVMVLPSGFATRIATIETADGQVDQATPQMSVILTLEDEIDISRGDMICRPRNQPTPTQDLDAMICWMDEKADLSPGKMYAIKHTTRWGRALVKDLHYRLNINTLHRNEDAESLALNEIGRATLRTTTPFFVDDYRRNRTTGAFILVDETTNATVGAGMITNS